MICWKASPLQTIVLLKLIFEPGFYISLGSKRISALVKEEYNSSKEISSSREADKIRHLILERLPLFLHEHSQTKMKVTFSWLQGEKNFIVRSFGKLSVTRSLIFEGASVSRPVETSAVARWNRNVLQLSLASNTEVDMYEWVYFGAYNITRAESYAESLPRCAAPSSTPRRRVRYSYSRRYCPQIYDH